VLLVVVVAASGSADTALGSCRGNWDWDCLVLVAVWTGSNLRPQQVWSCPWLGQS
jgi:hypothetical protein